MIEGLRIERTTPSFLASERLRHVLFGAHPYAIISPTEAQVEAYQPRSFWWSSIARIIGRRMRC